MHKKINIIKNINANIKDIIYINILKKNKIKLSYFFLYIINIWIKYIFGF
jgi:hypothetical protein